MTTETPELCACGCGHPKGPAHRGWSRACYFRWYRAGAVEGEAPPAPRNGPEYSASLREEVLWLVNRCAESLDSAAARVGVTVSTAQNYLAPSRRKPKTRTRRLKTSSGRRVGRPSKPRVSVTEKRCSTCGDVKASGEFTADRRAVDGLYSSCRTCCNERRRTTQPGVGRPRKQVAA
jgi:hypothetical protein